MTNVLHVLGMLALLNQAPVVPATAIATAPATVQVTIAGQAYQWVGSITLVPVPNGDKLCITFGLGNLTLVAPTPPVAGPPVPAPDPTPTPTPATVAVTLGQMRDATRNPLQWAQGQPPMVPTGSTVYLGGTNFGAISGTVTYDGKALVVLAWTETQITVLAPGLAYPAGAPLVITRADGAGSVTAGGFGTK